MTEVTRILQRIEAGGGNAAAELLPLVYEELRALARARMANELPNHTLQATALVHEAYLRLIGNDDRAWANRAQFFAAAAEAMRRILIDHARRRLLCAAAAIKRTSSSMNSPLPRRVMTMNCSRCMMLWRNSRPTMRRKQSW